MANRYPRILPLTIAMTSSWSSEESKKVIKMAALRGMPAVIELAYTCLSKKLCTGLFHRREKTSIEVAFHQSS